LNEVAKLFNLHSDEWMTSVFIRLYYY
jgi:hypothetical protein